MKKNPPEKFPTKYPLYYVSKCGRVYREPTKWDKTNELVEVGQSPRGGNEENGRYMSVNISLKDESGKFLKQIKVYTHRLIAETFLEKPSNDVEVNHIDKNKLNNTLSNLEWLTHKENFKLSQPPRKDGKWTKTTNHTGASGE